MGSGAIAVLLQLQPPRVRGVRGVHGGGGALLIVIGTGLGKLLRQCQRQCRWEEDGRRQRGMARAG